MSLSLYLLRNILLLFKVLDEFSAVNSVSAFSHWKPGTIWWTPTNTKSVWEDDKEGSLQIDYFHTLRDCFSFTVTLLYNAICITKHIWFKIGISTNRKKRCILVLLPSTLSFVWQINGPDPDHLLTILPVSFLFFPCS